MVDRRKQVVPWLIAAVAATAFSSCRRTTQDARAETPKAAPKKVAPKPQVLFFDKTVHVKDAAVIRFVERVVKVAVSGDYDKLRLLWTSHAEPISKSDFEKSWHNVKRVTVRLLSPVAMGGASVGSPPKPKPGYAMLADIQFDSAVVEHGGERGRRVALAMVREDDEWRLAVAPEGLRIWMDEELKRTQVEPVSDKAPASPPTSP